MEEALACVRHVLRHQVRRLGHGQEVLGIPGWDPPNVPILPFDQDCFASHMTVS
jgi:hypothetical protein